MRRNFQDTASTTFIQRCNEIRFRIRCMLELNWSWFLVLVFVFTKNIISIVECRYMLDVGFCMYAMHIAQQMCVCAQKNFCYDGT